MEFSARHHPPFNQELHELPEGARSRELHLLVLSHDGGNIDERPEFSYTDAFRTIKECLRNLFAHECVNVVVSGLHFIGRLEIPAKRELLIRVLFVLVGQVLPLDVIEAKFDLDPGLVVLVPFAGEVVILPLDIAVEEPDGIEESRLSGVVGADKKQVVIDLNFSFDDRSVVVHMHAFNLHSY